MSELKKKPIDLWLGIGGAVVGILLYLLPKTPGTTVGLLAISFFLLLHPAWNFWWMERKLWRKVAAIAVLAIAVTCVGILAWPSREIVQTASVEHRSATEMLTQWLMRAVAYARGLPWLWILVSFAIGAVATALWISAIHKRHRLIRERLLLAEREAENRAPKVGILSPMNRWAVGWRRTVRGSVFPPDSVVQVLVQFSDGWWYVQGPMEVAGHSWGCQCEFGEAGRKGHNYEVVALHGTSLKDKRYEQLPENAVRSNVVRVHRNSHEDEIDCPDKGLHQTKIDDKNAIKDLVIVCIVSCSTEVNQGDPHVNFTFHVLNMSLYPVSVEGVQGSIKFSQTLNYARERIPLRLPLSVGDADNLARHIPFRKTGSFTVCQPLTKENADYVKKMEGLFWLSDLTITIKGDEFEPVVILSGTTWVQKDRAWPSDRPESYFIYRDAVWAEAKIRTVEADRDALNKRLRIVEGLSSYVATIQEWFNRQPQSRQPLEEPLDEWLNGAGDFIKEHLGHDAVKDFYDGSDIGQPPPDALDGQVKWRAKYITKLKMIIKDQFYPPNPVPVTEEDEVMLKQAEETTRAWAAKRQPNNKPKE